ALLGAIPGCLGSFVAVSLYAHRRITLGAVVATMIATMGDATFVLLAMSPGTALWLIPALAALGVVGGWLTDLALPRYATANSDCDACELPVHEGESHQAWVPANKLLSQWRPPSPHRAILSVVVSAFALALAVGKIGPEEWDWIRITLLVVAVFGLFIALTVSDHFLDDHLWTHVLRAHVPRIFLWTLGAMAVIHLAEHFVDIEGFVEGNKWIVLVAAVVVGLIPDSGPHMIFVTLFAGGKLPLSILISNSIVQDGHGAIPLLAHSRRDFLVVKLINAAIGGAIGAGMLAAGW
ncbi:MAG: arsenic efflux protein, partial [Deltaproteobacteria bacterium]|nr:arsenic efflux protein [Deltaproteobacteria bacterium]